MVELFLCSKNAVWKIKTSFLDANKYFFTYLVFKNKHKWHEIWNEARFNKHEYAK